MRRHLATALAALAAALALAAPAGAADFGLNEFDVTFTDPGGSPALQAGSHPYEMKTSFNLNTLEEGGKEFPVEAIKDLTVAQVTGFAGDQTAVPPCSTLDFLTKLSPNLPNCADGTAIGYATVTVGEEKGKGTINIPVYFLEPSPGKVAKLGFWAQGVPISVDVALSETPPYNILAVTRNTSQVLEVYDVELTLWGVPADPAHDLLRGKCLGLEGESLGSCPAGVAEAPFLTLPRACAGPLATTWEANSWLHPETILTGFALTHDDAAPPNPVGFSGCGKLGFGPRVSALPSATSAESSSGLEVEIEISDEGLKNPEGIAQADIAKAVLTLPAGVTANPSAAEGLGVCTLAQYEAEGLGTRACPDSSKLGSVQVQTPLLEGHTVPGAVYLAQPDEPATAGKENPFDSLLAIYLVLRDPGLGIFVKQAGEIEADPATGRLLTTFADIPQFPLSRVAVRLRSGPRAPLITPPLCGAYESQALLTPTSGAPAVAVPTSFTIATGPGGGPCPAGAPPFAPGFSAGTQSNAAATYSPFFMRLTRADGEQDITRFSATLPPGVVGRIAGVPACPDAAIAAASARSGRAELASPSCPAATRIGRVEAGAGVGTALTYVGGTIYLAGPYKGAPLSVAVITPAVAGPFDVGTVVVRVGLDLNPDTGQVEVDGSASDPIPHILKGIPLKLRDLRVYVDRPQFTLNATSCEPMQVTATAFGGGLDPFSAADDRPTALAERYQAADCQSLAFKPKLSLALKGAVKRSGNPALRATLTARPGDANVKGAVVSLPPSQFIDNAHINNPCTREQFAASACPRNSILGRARAFTPLLDDPLEGPVYFRSNGGARDLPDVVAELKGQFRFVLVIAVLTSKNGRITTRVLNAPDAPVSKVVLNMQGGKRGLLENSEHLCRRTQRANVKLIGQNGDVRKTRPKLATSCKKQKRAKGSKR